MSSGRVSDCEASDWEDSLALSQSARRPHVKTASPSGSGSDSASDSDSDSVSGGKATTKPNTAQKTKLKSRTKSKDLHPAKNRRTRGPLLISIDFSVPRPVKALGTVKMAGDATAARSTLSKAFRLPSITDPTRQPLSIRGAGGAAGGAWSLGMVRRGASALLDRPLHDPDEPGALVLHAPPPRSATVRLDALKHKSINSAPPPEVHVVVDPFLGSKLRPHQVEGVRFLYDCTTGSKVDGAFGCIIADEMVSSPSLSLPTLLPYSLPYTSLLPLSLLTISTISHASRNLLSKPPGPRQDLPMRDPPLDAPSTIPIRRQTNH